MTVYEYIKKKATKEDIAKMFCFLENDSGYYSENNASVLLMINNLSQFIPEEFEDKKMYNLVMKTLDKEVK